MKKTNVALIASMPWPTYNMPSIQVGVLKSFIERDGHKCIGAHWFLDIYKYLGHDLYTSISSEYLIVGEAIYSSLYFEEHREEIVKSNPLLQKTLSSDPTFLEKLDQKHDEILLRYNWNEIDLVGFTLNFSQTMPSIYMAAKIKRLNPKIKIIIGGAEGTSEMGASLIDQFDCIDFACNGEGEQLLLELVKSDLVDLTNIKKINSLIYRENGKTYTNPSSQLDSLRNLPVPNLDEYFTGLALNNLNPYDLSVVLPIESSRGCYYSCSFCSLNIQWDGTRFQYPETVKNNISELVAKYKILDFFFVDNITPINSKEIFSEVQSLNFDIRFFYEMRANISYDSLKAMHKAGLKRVQIGTEAMSSSLLRKFNKKSLTIHNIQGLKNCEELGIIVSSNFIINHPSTDQNDINETIKNISYCYHLRPPSAFSEFGLMFGSPDYNSPKDTFSIKGNHKDYRKIYPRKQFDALNLPVKEYITKSKPPDWSSIKQIVEHWKKTYNNKTTHLLSMQDGGTFLKIEDRRYGPVDVFILDKTERDLYLLISQITPFAKIKNKYPDKNENELRTCLQGLIDLKLVFEEDDKFLSLAIRSD
ncbi:RiPP maturation radical SAM C-methyltransferase [Fulvivirga sp. 29W222]|uniref:RiPP maturation radical SAM C-methyltransferase n=1 Tax=Fulvivirga marina TaxID=2494733 RepID=A0A937KC13_9BACT|nr:RiPP maturation radical SAM C-methyltransferase [Fulvivirga marina]MBL6447661.1 RiPP maturation radical SAM C-methyltransferase [Fulvivirga marina]